MFTRASSPYKPFGTLRFVLALMVLVQHFCDDIAPDFIKQAVFPWKPGNVAVIGFFIISGFIICEAYHYNYRERPVAYLKNRFMRIVPGYWVALLLSILVHFAFFQQYGHATSLDRHWIEGAHFSFFNLLKNFLTPFPPIQVHMTPKENPFIPYAWTLQTEMMFYLTVFFVGCGYLVIKRYIKWPEGYWLALAGFAGIAAATFVQLGWLPKQLAYGSYFAFGGSLFFFLQGYRKAAFVLLPAFAQMMWQFHNLMAEDFDIIPANRPGQLLLLAIILVAIVVLATAKIRHTKIDKRLGELSYPLYLHHYVIAVIILNTAKEFTVTYLLAGLAASLALTTVMYLLVEKPLIKVRRYIREKNATTPTVPRN